MSHQQFEILLVDDNTNDVELTVHVLRKGNLANHIHIARDGEEAWEFLFNSAYDRPPKLILLDLKLPKVDGMEVLRRVKTDPRTRTIPVVILTSSKEERDLVQGYGLGANSYIQKPVDFEQFRDTIKNVGLYWLLINQPPVAARLALPHSLGRMAKV
jgi:two-component system response regulator